VNKILCSYKVYRTRTLDKTAKGKLDQLMHRPEFDFWNMPRSGRQVDIMVAPEHAQELESTLQRLDLSPIVVNHNVGE